MADGPYRTGTGPERKPQGTATELNDAQAGLPQPGAPPEQVAPPEQAPAEAPAQTGTSGEGGPMAAPTEPFRPANDAEAWLASPSGRPLESTTTFGMDHALPPGSESWVAAIQADANRPDATIWMKQAAARLAEQQRLSQRG